ncbi:trimeric intracellular cation channel family protein [Streptomyces griseoaurantiacus]|uniref:trimeric intracellular cation channel family protein n=1 Tax=Streptomyces griseoaurantiacus TaxID=68213 RepID=UPI00177DD9AF|nr:hypothetical protein GCM10018782_40230 [Streptomyces griseoaurantiacus]
MPINELNGVTQYVMDLVGIFSFALSGAFIAVRRDFDVFGTVILSEAAGLGGGLFRDLVLQVPPAAFTDLGYYFTPVGAAAAVYFGHRLYDDLLVRRSVLFDVPDAGALGLFSVTGTIKALTHGFNVPAAVTLGAASAVGGGVLASVLAMEVPSLLRWDSDLYALPAVAGAGSTAVLHLAGTLNVGTAVGASVFAISLRLLALRYGWRTPRSHFWRDPFSGMRHQPVAEPARPAPPVPLEADTVTLNPFDAHTATVRRGDLAHGGPLPAHVRDPRIGWGGPMPPHARPDETGPDEAREEPRRC